MLPLKYFIHRSMILNQYREFLRATRPLEGTTRQELRREIRRGFEQSREASLDDTPQLLQRGREELKHIQALCHRSMDDPRDRRVSSSSSNRWPWENKSK